jgi:hypothetical protein
MTTITLDQEDIQEIQKMTSCSRSVAERAGMSLTVEELRSADIRYVRSSYERRNTRPLRRAVKRATIALRAESRARALHTVGIAGRIARRVLDVLPGLDASEPGWSAADTIAEAAQAEGCIGDLLCWMMPSSDLASQIEGYLARYAQSYGPVEDCIDVRGHITGTPGVPMIVRVS